MLGGFLALLSAAAFSMNNAAARRGVLSGTVLQAMAISVPFGVPFFIAGLLIFGSFDDLALFSPHSLIWLAGAGVLHFVVGRYANYRGAKAIGANLMGPIQDVNILISLGLAVACLGETITPIMALGIVLVCLGPVLSWQGSGKGSGKGGEKRPPRQRPLSYTPAYAEGFFFAALSALAYGASPILVRLGLEDSLSKGLAKGLGSGVAAGLVSYLAATLVVGAMLLWPGNVAHVRRLRGHDAKWFLVAGLFVGVAQMLRYMALALAPVSVVAPMMRLSSVFRIYFSWLINPEHEEFSRSVVLATFVSLAGAMILTLSADFVIQALGLSPGMGAFLRRSWP